MTKVEEKVKKILVNLLGVEESEITSTTTLMDLGGDSLDAIEIIMDCESEFGISIPDDDTEKLDTFEKLVNYITMKIK